MRALSRRARLLSRVIAARIGPHVRCQRANRAWGTLSCFATGTGAVSPGGDNDFWKIPLVAGERAWISTDTGATQNGGATSRDTAIDLLDTGGTTVLENDDDGNGGDGTVETGVASSIADKALTSTGDGYIHVNAFNATAVVDPYRIIYASTPNAAVAEAASDDTAATAMASPGTDLLVEMRDPADSLLLSVDSSITGSLTNPVAEGADFVAPVAGTYFLKVRHFSALGAGSYIDGVDVTTPVSAVLAIADTAFPLTFGNAAGASAKFDEFALTTAS
jgi:hypothetical protein